MDVATAAWIAVPLALVHAFARRRRALLLFQLAVDVMLLLLPGRLIVRGLHIAPGGPGSQEWGGAVTVAGSPEQSDFPLQLAVWWSEVRRLAAAGEPPTISDRIGGGTPLLAAGQSQILFPLHLPVWVLGPERGNDVMAIWKLEIAALGGFALLCRLRLLPTAAAAGALAYAFSLFHLSWLVSPLSWVIAALPWAWWLLIATLRGSHKSAAGLAVVLGILAGWSVNPEAAAFLWLGVACGGLVLALGRWRRIKRVALPFALALPVAAVGALPTLATIADSPRLEAMTASAPYPSADVTWSLRGRVLALLVTPWRDGHPATGTWAHGFPAAAVSIGVGCVCLACLLAGLPPRRRLHRSVTAFVVVGMCAGGLMFQLPGFTQLASRVPGLRILIWARAAFLIPFALTMAAAVGADSTIRDRRRWRLAAWALALTCVAISLLATAPVSARARSGTRIGLLVPAVAAALAPGASAAGGLAIPVLVGVESLVQGQELLPGSTSSGVGEPPAAAELRRLVDSEGGRVLGLGAALAGNTGARLGVADLRSDSPVRSGALARLHRAFGAAGMGLPGPVTKPWAALAGAWGVRWLATPPEGVVGPTAAGWEEVYRDAGGRLYRNSRALPVLRLVSSVVTPPGDPGAGGWEAVDFRTRAVTSEPVTLGGEGSLTVIEERPCRHVARVRSQGTVLAVLHVTRAPGWSAALDGRPTALLDADLGAMAVVVPSGQHEVRWAYAPPLVVPGAVLTGAGLLACIFLAVRSRWRP